MHCVNIILGNGDLLESPGISEREIRRLVGWQALSLADLLWRQCITVRYAERSLFNLEVVQQLERRSLIDCVELIDWGMQLEDWDEHTPDQLPDALVKISELAQQLLATERSTASGLATPR